MRHVLVEMAGEEPARRVALDPLLLLCLGRRRIFRRRLLVGIGQCWSALASVGGDWLVLTAVGRWLERAKADPAYLGREP